MAWGLAQKNFWVLGDRRMILSNLNEFSEGNKEDFF